MIDDGEADDKIISVLQNDYVWGAARDVTDVPPVFVERLQHYFLTYKLVPGKRSRARIAKVYGRVHALKVVRAAMADYDDNFVCAEGARPCPSTSTATIAAPIHRRHPVAKITAALTMMTK